MEGCADEAFRAAYTSSQGLCLPHLRQVLEEAARTNPDVASYLAEDAAMRLATLRQDLGEYLRKRAWQYRHEITSNEEASAPGRAARFFGGTDLAQPEPEDTGSPPVGHGRQDDEGFPA